MSAVCGMMDAECLSIKYMHTYCVIACRHRRSPHCQRFKVAMWLESSPIQSGRFHSSNDTTTHKLVTTSEPANANTITEARGPQSRGEATWRAAGVNFDRLCMPS